LFRELTVINFQSWKKQVFTFSPGVNVFIGTSDTGKSAAFLRAIRLLATNRPAGSEFISTWAGKDNMVVELVVDNGQIVFREKGKSTNLYGIGYADGSQDDQEFAAFGMGVPEEVQRLLNLDPINIQGQLDGPFLLNMSPGDVARELNRACKLEGIDRGIVNSSKRARGLEQKVDSITGQIKSHEEHITALAWLDEVETKLVTLEQKRGTVTELLEKGTRLRGLIQTIENEKENVSVLSVRLKAEPQITTLWGKYNQYEQLIKKKRRLRELCVAIERQKETVDKNRALLKASDKLKKLIALHNEKEKQRTRQNNLNYLIDSVGLMQVEHDKAKKKQDKLEEEYHKVMPDTCPLCGKAQ
jgi:exonuclease SbcC